MAKQLMCVNIVLSSQQIDAGIALMMNLIL